MNSELRAKLETFDIWHLTLDNKKKKRTVEESANDKERAWQAYYQIQKNRAVGQSEHDTPSQMVVPECFKDIAAAKGVYQQEQSPSQVSKSVKNKARLLVTDGVDHNAYQQQIEDLEREILKKSKQLEQIDAELQSALQREKDNGMRLEALEDVVRECRQQVHELKDEKVELTEALQSSVERCTQLKTQVELHTDHEVSLQAELDQLLSEREQCIANQSDQLQDAIAKAETAQAALEDLRTEKETVLSNMKHAKQQFDKLRTQHHDRKLENSALKEEIEELKRQQQLGTESKDSRQLQDDIDRLQSLLKETETQKAEANEQIKAAQEQVENLQSELSAKEERLEQLSDDLNVHQNLKNDADLKTEALAAKVESVTEMLEECRRTLETKRKELDTQMAETSDWKEKMEAALQTRTEEVEDLTEILDQREQEMEALQTVHQDLASLKTSLEIKDNEITELHQSLTAARDEASAVQSQKFAVEEDLHQQNEQLSKREAEVLKLKAEFHAVLVQLDAMNEELNTKDAQLQQQASSTESLLVELRIDNERVTSVVKEKEEEIDRLSSQLQDCLIETDKLQTQAEKLYVELESKNERIVTLQEKSEADCHEQNQVIEKLRKEKNELAVQFESLTEEVKSFEGARARIPELESLFAEAQSREESAGNKISELDSALSEALEIAEIAEKDSRQTKEAMQRLKEETADAQAVSETAVENAHAAEEALHQVQESLDLRTADLSQVQLQLSRKEVEVESLRTRFRTAETQLSETTTELEALRYDLSTSKLSSTELTEKNAEICNIKEQLQTTASAKEELETIKLQLEKDLYELRSQLAELRQELEASDAHKDDLTKQVELSKQYEYDLLEEIENLKTEVSTGDAATAAQEKLIVLEAQFHEALAAKRVAEKEVEQLRKKVDDVVGLQQKVIRLETALAVSGASQPSHFALPSQPTAELKALQQRIAETEAREADLSAEVESLRITLDEARKQSTHRAGPSEASAQLVVGGLSNKKDEDKGYDVEAAVLSGGDPSGFQPLSGMLRGVPAMKYLTACIRAADFVDRGFIVLMRHPMLRYILLAYFAVLHVLLFI